MAGLSTEIDLVALLGTFPAEGALFTTFTLSLSWFEVYLLRRLERQGARRIAVLADGEGVAMSLREGLARGPGLRYGLEAIHLPRGTFHPKVALLWGQGRVVLAVGSGNLTLPGMHRNLECWDVLLGGWPDVPAPVALSRSVAAGADGFLTKLQSLVDAEAWSTRVITEARGALRSVATGLIERDDIWWLDSGRRPIGQQVTEAMGVASRELEFLSPFHDPSGRAVQDLAHATGAQALKVLYADDTTFPLSRVRSAWTGSLSALQVSAKARPLHAKVYHWRSDTDAWLLSGSANATMAALWTTDNMEACLLRHGPRDAWDELLAGSEGVPVERSQPAIIGTATPIRILYARASERGVTVKLEATAGQAPKTVRLSFLEHGGEVEQPWNGGVASIPLPTEHDPLHPLPLRVEAQAIVGDRLVRARAWVSFETWLEASPRWRRVALAWARLLRGSGDDDEDEIELLQVFAEEHSRTISTLASARRRGSTGERNNNEKADLPVPVRLLELAATREYRSEDLHVGAATGSTVDGVLEAMRSAFRTLDQRAPSEAGETEDDAPSPPTARRTPPRVREALDTFEQRFLDESRALSSRPANPSHVLAYAGLCARMALRVRLRDAERPELIWNTADRWVRALLLPRAAGMPLLSLLAPPEADVPREVLAHYAGLLAALLWHVEGGRLGGEPEQATDRGLLGISALREALATLRRFDAQSCDDATLPIDFVMGSGPADLAAVLAAASREPAPSDRMRWLVRSAHRAAKGRALAALEEEALSGGLGTLTQDEREVLQHARRGRRCAPSTPWVEQCPVCWGALSSMVRARLNARVPARCPSMRCGAWIIPSEGT